MKSNLLEKIARRLNYNSEYEADEDLIEDFIDSAINEIIVWRRLDSDEEILSGRYDTNIVNFVIESYNIQGIEGQSYEGNGATSKQFTESPLSRLKSSIPQRMWGRNVSKER